MFFYKQKVRFTHWLRYELPHRVKPPRITALTALLWLALLCDLAAPGYLVFHLGFTRLDVPAISQAATEASTSTLTVGRK